PVLIPAPSVLAPKFPIQTPVPVPAAWPSPLPSRCPEPAAEERERRYRQIRSYVGMNQRLQRSREQLRERRRELQRAGEALERGSPVGASGHPTLCFHLPKTFCIWRIRVCGTAPAVPPQ
uniref:CS025 protein n=1 Tax=Taeniopygia guttata TaxID=59729 RepID=A0A674G8H7_TAEGU